MPSERKYGGYTLKELDGTPLVKGAFEPIIEDFVDRVRELEAALELERATLAHINAEAEIGDKECCRENARLRAENVALTAERDARWTAVPIERGQTVLVAIHGSNGLPYAQRFDYNPDPFPRAVHHCPAETPAAALSALAAKMETK